jgi:hypothetical protein
VVAWEELFEEIEFKIKRKWAKMIIISVSENI